MKTLQAKLKEAEQAQHKERAQLEALKEQLQAAETKSAHLETELKEHKRQLAALRRLQTQAQAQQAARQAEAQQTRERRHALVRQCVREELPLPLTRDSPPLPQETEADPRASEDLVFDWSALGDRVKRLKKGDLAPERLAVELEAKAAELLVEAERVAPNLKAAAHLDELEAKLDALQIELDEAQTAAKAAQEHLQQIKKQRLERYQTCFEHVSQQIDSVYRSLNGGQGAAYLTQASMDEPYLAGTLYSPQPPNKPFSDLAQLSGGEKSLAALALLFALATWRPAPFFILDEIDAALDPSNVLRLARFIRAKAEEEGVQFVVISLKERLYETADALVGVHVEPSKDASALLTLDLRNFA